MSTYVHPPSVVRVLIADDHEVVRLGAAACLAARPDIEVVASVGDFRAVQEVLRWQPVDVAILDIAGMGAPAGPTIERLLVEYPRLRIIAFSGQTEAVSSVMAMGVHGYVTKTEYAQSLMEAIDSVTADISYVSPMAQRQLTTDQAFITQFRLTPKQLLITQLLATGRKPEEIAEELCLNRNTVYNQLTRIYERTGIKGHVQLARLYQDVLAEDKEPD